jgi:hypothetical protein
MGTPLLRSRRVGLLIPLIQRRWEGLPDPCGSDPRLREEGIRKESAWEPIRRPNLVISPSRVRISGVGKATLPVY